MNPIKMMAELLITGGAIYFPPLALAQPILSPILDKAPDSKALKSILKKLIDRGADISNPGKALEDHKEAIAEDVKLYYAEVLEEVNKPTERVSILNAGIQEILNSIVQANQVYVRTHSSGKTLIAGSHVAGNHEVNIVTDSNGHTRITDSVIGKNGGMKSVTPKGWQVDQPSGWVQQYNPDGSWSIGYIGPPPTQPFTIGHDGKTKDSFKMISEQRRPNQQ